MVHIYTVKCSFTKKKKITLSLDVSVVVHPCRTITPELEDFKSIKDINSKKSRAIKTFLIDPITPSLQKFINGTLRVSHCFKNFAEVSCEGFL